MLPYDYKSDIWSLGCILYELCQLKPPFRGTSLKNLCINVQKGMYNPIPDYYSDNLKKIIGMMLQRDPEKRPTTGQLLGSDIITKKINELKINMKYSGTEEKQGLIATIQMPMNLGEINKSLPGNKYNIKQIQEEMLMEDEYETNKRKNGFLDEDDKQEIKKLYGNNNIYNNKGNNLKEINQNDKIKNINKNKYYNIDNKNVNNIINDNNNINYQNNEFCDKNYNINNIHEINKNNNNYNYYNQVNPYNNNNFQYNNNYDNNIIHNYNNNIIMNNNNINNEKVDNFNQNNNFNNFNNNVNKMNKNINNSYKSPNINNLHFGKKDNFSMDEKYFNEKMNVYNNMGNNVNNMPYNQNIQYQNNN